MFLRFNPSVRDVAEVLRAFRTEGLAGRVRFVALASGPDFVTFTTSQPVIFSLNTPGVQFREKKLRGLTNFLVYPFSFFSIRLCSFFFTK